MSTVAVVRREETKKSEKRKAKAKRSQNQYILSFLGSGGDVSILAVAIISFNLLVSLARFGKLVLRQADFHIYIVHSCSVIKDHQAYVLSLFHIQTPTEATRLCVLFCLPRTCLKSFYVSLADHQSSCFSLISHPFIVAFSLSLYRFLPTY